MSIFTQLRAKISKLIIRLLEKTGFTIVQLKDWIDDIPDFSATRNSCKEYTMTSKYRGYSAYQAAQYIVDNGIEGDFVECGVRRGGSSMILMNGINKKKGKRIFRLYDTYDGMTTPTEKDVASYYNKKASDYYQNENEKYTNPEGMWCYAPLDAVKMNIAKVYNLDDCKFIQGKVEDTIPQFIPDKISLLRLDTDFYESTSHEMKYLFPKLVTGGILIIDDYGFRRGSKEAIDEYLNEHKIKILLHRIDDTGVIGIKL